MLLIWLVRAIWPLMAEAAVAVDPAITVAAAAAPSTVVTARRRLMVGDSLERGEIGAS
jgi:hypothetical protein